MYRSIFCLIERSPIRVMKHGNLNVLYSPNSVRPTPVRQATKSYETLVSFVEDHSHLIKILKAVFCSVAPRALASIMRTNVGTIFSEISLYGDSFSSLREPTDFTVAALACWFIVVL